MDVLSVGHPASVRSRHPSRGHTLLRTLVATKRLILKEDRYFVVSGLNGSMHADSPDGHGLWLGDTRYLSDYRLTLNGLEPEPVGIATDDAALVIDTKLGALQIRTERFIDGGLHERITITNTGSTSEGAHLDLLFAADFAAMLRLRGVLPAVPLQPATEVPGWQGFVLRQPGSESLVTSVTIDPDGRHHRVELEPGRQFVLRIEVVPGSGSAVKDFDAAVQQVRSVYGAWASDCAQFVTDNPALNEVIEQARDDLRMLCEDYKTGLYPTAGLPWFAVPFGRDALFISMFMLPVNPEIARGSLRFLAEHQGKVDDPSTEEQPGKILHEVRTGEIVTSGTWPHILYGTTDATPLYLYALADVYDWTGDIPFFNEIWPAALRALEWCQQFGDTDGDGWIDYHGARFRNQGWKDSDDSLTHVDGTPAPNPAGLCEVQAYYYGALLALSKIRPELKDPADKLRDRFNKDFWMRDERFVAQGLDGQHRQVQAITSNPGHCLWMGILPDDRARQVGERLMAGDMWTGWGIRTLSEKAKNYDPCSYHNGSVWPHDSTIAAAGMRRAGLEREAEQIARAILEAGMAFPDRRIPELWCGRPRQEGELPDDYRNSCSPQGWAAASVFSLLSTLLGLEADAPKGRLRIAPLKTSLFQRLDVTGLHFKGERVSFSVTGDRVKVGQVPKGIKIQT
jgi:glycogen debranching enzyme